MRRLLRWSLYLALGLLILSLLPVLALRWAPPPTSSVMMQRALAESGAQRYLWVPADGISADAALAVVAAEDQKFPYHWGFDLEAIQDAIRHNERSGPLRGASTLTQQVARNLFLWQGKSYLRKSLEAWFSGLIEVFWPKRRILEIYLNIAEMGDGIFGVEAASQRFFGRSAHDISREQAALLAAVLPSPKRYRVDRPSAYVRKRQDWVLEQMRQLGGTAYLRDVWPMGAR